MDAMNALWTRHGVHNGVAGPAVRALIGLALLAKSNTPRECRMDGDFGWTMKPCHQLPYYRERHFTDAGTGYDGSRDEIVITCTETVAAAPVAAETEGGTDDGYKNRGGDIFDNVKDTISGLMQGLQAIEWNKMSRSATELIKEDLPTEEQTDHALEVAKHALKSTIDDLRNVEWEKVPGLAKEEYIVGITPTEDQARKAFESAKIELKQICQRLLQHRLGGIASRY